MSARTVHILRMLLLSASILVLASCIEPAVVSADAQRVVAVPTSAPAEPLLEPGDAVAPAATTVPDGEATAADPEATGGGDEEGGVEDPAAEEDVADLAPTDATLPADLCDPDATAPVARAVEWTDIDLGRDFTTAAFEYVNSLGDASQSFLEGTLSCSSTYSDGSVLALSTYSNYTITTYAGTRLSGTEAGSITVLVSADPETVRAIIEYPWAPSPTGFAALEVSFTDPAGIDSTEIDTIENLALGIRDRVAFEPPAVAGPAYPEWYNCSLTQFGTTRGDTAALAAALGQGQGMHAAETIDRQFGTSRCSLYAGPGTSSSGGFAVSGVFVALAAYESGRPTFADTVSQVLASSGVEQGELTVGGATYRTAAGQGSYAVIIETGGNGVMSVFDPAGETTLPQLQAIMTPILQQLFG